ncbi:MAG: DNA repair exonuclease [Salinarimonadaceae bacterium]|nr:MAG: DNA repair exonuclease [Salinarimonadaceae bacterium]
MAAPPASTQPRPPGILAATGGSGMRFIHTADWQIGKVFRRFGEREPLFAEARLAAIEAIGELAIREGARHVLVAGDLYDVETPQPATLRGPLERMRRFAGVIWHILPGNHDADRPRGVWERVAEADAPENVRVHRRPEPVALEPGVFLLPAPLARRAEASDLTAWMDDAPTPEGALRIGIAHGSVTGFDSQGEANNPVDPARPGKAGLAYLALGDWHRTLRISDRVWYAGTPEPDRFDSQETGKALVVETRGGDAAPAVREAVVGRYRWLSLDAEIADDDGAGDIEARIRGLDNLSTLVLRLRIGGAVSLSGRRALEAALARLGAACAWLDPDLEALRARPSQADLEAIDFDGALRDVAERLQARIADDAAAPDSRAIAEEALTRLYLMATEGARR